MEASHTSWEEGPDTFHSVIVRDITARRQAEQQLKDNEERFRSIVESSHDAIVTCDSKGIIVSWNRAAEQMYGYSREEILGRYFSLIADPLEKSAQEQALGMVAAGRQAFSPVTGRQYTATRKDGSTFRAELSQSTWTQQGELYFTGVIRDISETRKAEDDLRFQAMILDQIEDRVTATDLDGRITYVNDAECRTLKRSRDELIGQSVELYGEDTSRGAAQRDIIEATRANGAWRGEVVNYAKDGTESILDCRSRVIYDRDETPVGMCGISTDITRQKHLEQRLLKAGREVELINRLANVFLLSPPDNMFNDILDILLASLASKLGYIGFIDEQGSLVCPSMTRTVWDKCEMAEKSIVFDRNAWGGLWGKSLMEKKTLCLNSNLSPPEGHLPLDNALAVPIVYRGTLIGQIVVANKNTDYAEDDIERLEHIAHYISPILHGKLENDKREKERRHMEEQLHQAQKIESIGTLAGGIAHDFNNMLGVIIGNIEMLMDDAPPDSQAYRTAEQVQKAAFRARDLVKQILTFSRKDKQKMASLHLGPLVKESLKMLRSTIPATVDILSSIDCPHDCVMADATQINQVLMNLCVNAEQAMTDTGGSLEIGLENITLEETHIIGFEEVAAGNYAVLSVKDTGCGIPEDSIDKIFDPFFTTKEVDKGTGLGLSVVYGIVKNHKGAVTVESEPGRGTTFKVLLPLAKDQVIETASAERPLPGGSEHILLIDDEHPLLMIAERMLRKLGYAVTACTDSRGALDRFMQAPGTFDLVVTDMTMPVMTGKVLAEMMLSVRSDLPIIVCTGHSDHISEDICRRTGIKALIMKPFNRRELAATVRDILDGRSL